MNAKHLNGKSSGPRGPKLPNHTIPLKSNWDASHLGGWIPVTTAFGTHLPCSEVSGQTLVNGIFFFGGRGVWVVPLNFALRGWIHDAGSDLPDE